MGGINRIAIVGGGIGGMATAVALHARGIPVDVYEKAKELTEVGAGVHLSPNSVRVLEPLGFAGAFSELGALGASLGDLYQLDGRVVRRPVGMGAVGLHRADLLAMLVRALPPERVHTDKCCTGIAQFDDHATVSFEDGTTVDADAVLAADGIRSTLRDYVVPPSEPVSSGFLVYRGLIDHSGSSEWAEFTDCIWGGYGRHLVAFPIRGGRTMTHVAFIPTTEPMADPSRPDEVRALLREQFRGWDPMVQSIVGEMGECLRLEVFDREPAARWTDGRLALLGDAAHSMQPHVAQGANQAIEDAGALAVVLDGADNADIPSALRSYQRVRKHRTDLVQRMSRRFGLFYDSNCWRDDILLDEFPYIEQFFEWLYGYDVQRAAAAQA